MSKQAQSHVDVRTADRTTTSNTLQVTNTRFAKSLMAAWHQREVRFALRCRHTSQLPVSLASVSLTVAAPASESVASVYRPQLCTPMLWSTAPLPLITARGSGERYTAPSGSVRRPASERIFVQSTAPNLQMCYKFHPRAQDAHTLGVLQ